MNKPNWIIGPINITVNYDGQTHIVARDSELGKNLYQAIKDENYEAIPEIVSIAKSVKEFSDGKFTVVDGELLIGGTRVPSQLAKKIMQFKEEGLPYQPLVNFAEKLLQNPSYRAVNELFQFLEKNDHPICEDGDLIAFRRVRGDFKDIYTGKFDNSPGQILEMPRNQVNEDQHQTCSNGFHASSLDYCWNHYASSDPTTDVILEVKIDPRDVVSVPVDYSNAKMRICRYEVLRVVDPETIKDVKERVRYQEPQVKNWDDEDEDEWTESSEEEDWEESSEEYSWDDSKNSYEEDVQTNTTENRDPFFHDENPEHDPWDNHNE